MKPFYYFTAICATSLMLLTSACSDGDNTETKVIKKFPDVEAVAKQHAQEFTQSPASGKSTQKKLFKIRAHEQDLRNEGLNDEADYYIKMFEHHLAKYNPTLADSIIQK